MYVPKTRLSRRVTAVSLAAMAVCLTFLAFAEQASAIPVFARKYRTSCITCHAGFPKLNGVGEAFRRNGFQFPADEDLLVKDEPIPMGNESYKDLWPDAIWPSDIPHLPPVAFRARLGFKQFLNRPAPVEAGTMPDPKNDFQFPMDYSLLSAGTFGEDISWYAGMVLAGKGGHGGGGHGGGGGLEPELERLYVQFSNLFAWSQYEDDDGMREGHRFITLPRHAFNLRLGQFEPQVIAPWASIHRQWGVTGRLPNVFSYSDSHFENGVQSMNSFSFEPALRGIEAHGVLRQYYSYAVGIVNGSGTMMGAWDNNDNKDFYFRVSRKWFGFPLDGVLGEATAVDDGEGDGFDEVALGAGMDFWREIQFETGFFGYFGRNTVMVSREGDVEAGNGLEFELSKTIMMFPDKFERIGVDARFQFQDLDLFGAAIWGWNSAPGAAWEDGELEIFRNDNMFMWFLEANYFIKPWLTTYARYEQTHFDRGHFENHKGIQRAVVGSVATIRANMRLVGEFVIDARGLRGEDELEYSTHDAFNLILDFAY